MVKFRTQYNLIDDKYEDGETYEPGTSETEEGQEVNIQTVYNRCMRGDISALQLLAGDYDIKGDMDIDEAFDTIDPTRSEGFDFVDASAITDQLAKKLSKSEEVAVTEQGAANLKASDERDLKANSDASMAEEKPIE